MESQMSAADNNARGVALSTRGLSRSFGSLVVARDINLDLPVGARYALIGPNGAG
jgi:branched-chain amino acid transport system ATP-binding protein